MGYTCTRDLTVNCSLYFIFVNYLGFYQHNRYGCAKIKIMIIVIKLLYVPVETRVSNDQDKSNIDWVVHFNLMYHCINKIHHHYPSTIYSTCRLIIPNVMENVSVPFAPCPFWEWQVKDILSIAWGYTRRPEGTIFYFLQYHKLLHASCCCTRDLQKPMSILKLINFNLYNTHQLYIHQDKIIDIGKYGIKNRRYFNVFFTLTTFYIFVICHTKKPELTEFSIIQSATEGYNTST